MGFLLPYPDEILYSVIARYKRHRNVSNRLIMLELYGREKLPYIDLPAMNNYLLDHSPLGEYYDAETLIEEHTLYPFYATFLPQSYRDQLKTMLLENSKIHAYGKTGGVFNDNSLTINELKYCPQCLQEDIDRYGEPYWHRIHQIVGIKLCPNHHVQLLSSCPVCRVTIADNFKTELMALSEECTNGHKLTLTESSKVPNEELHLHYAQNCLQVLKAGMVFELDEIRKKYNTQMKYLGLAALGGKMYQDKCKESFLNYYGSEYLKSNESILSEWTNWLIRSLRVEGIIHPFRQLHIIAVLFESFDIFCGAPTEFEPFGKGPWPCLNPLSDHYRLKVIDEYNLSFSHDKIRGLFACGCGFEYARWMDDDEYSYRKVIKHGSEWEKKLSEMMANPSLDSKEIAKRAGLKTISDYRQDGSYKRVRTPFKKEDDLEEKIEKYRLYIIKVMEENPEAKRKDMNSLAAREYQYLLKHDTEWLNGILPSSMRGTNTGIKVDYAKQDQFYVELFNSIASNIYKESGQPRRITKGELFKKAKAWKIRSYPTQYPLANQVVDQLVEPIDNYHLRAIEWAKNELVNTSIEITEANIRSLLGIRMKFSEIVQQYIDEIIKTNL